LGNKIDKSFNSFIFLLCYLTKGWSFKSKFVQMDRWQIRVTKMGLVAKRAE